MAGKAKPVAPARLTPVRSTPSRSAPSRPSHPSSTKTAPIAALPKPGRRNLFDEEDEEDEAEKDKILSDAQRKKRKLNVFMESLKRENEDLETRVGTRKSQSSTSGKDNGRQSLVPRTAFEGRQGSHDVGDPRTTNLFVSNIPEGIDEQTLAEHFGKYGSIASVKIMWPWSQEEKAQKAGRLCGFVAFMRRKDAEEALAKLNGAPLRGNPLACGWGKTVPLPTKPFYTARKETKQLTTGQPFNAQSPRRRSKGRSSGSTTQAKAEVLEVHVQKPKDRGTVHLIHRMVERVIRHGPRFEAAIMEREKNNPKFGFLFDHRHPNHVYYRWRLFASLNGDRSLGWRERPFRLFDEGAIWFPPTTHGEPREDRVSSMDISAESDAEYEQERECLPRGQFGPVARRRLIKMIRLHTEHEHNPEMLHRIGELSISHVDCANEVIDVITQSLLLPDTPYLAKLVRLRLVTEILRHSGQPIPGAWKLRAGFETSLPQIFAHFGHVFSTIASRLKADNFKRQVFDHLHAWETHSLFTHDQLSDFANKFDNANSTLKDTSEEINVETPVVPRVERVGFRPIGAASAEESAMHQEMVSIAASSAVTTQNGDETGARHDADKEEEADDADIDGEPMSELEPAACPPSARSDSEEDIDGAPITNMAYSDTHTAANANHADDDIDEDIDGLPIPAADDDDDDEEIDGLPMDVSSLETGHDRLPSELTEKVQRYQASLAAMPHLHADELARRVDAFRERLIHSQQVPPTGGTEPHATAPTTAAQQQPTGTQPSSVDDIDMFAA
ncbi:hypothetical protein THASP1DRAFT_31338 [Thamnocephalis sphaerospora]|uniref:Uncharacterized protein n=1 Tax=Thamnocephalis sphaerospora TaxID=78915 RepID=A0A4P9XLZ0_9FUNG|nr:hypothetical protein THASP1DRAFT_31338 [Thamnocephalis sphaerospora]|eukprot:RKP06852.1 hypothetical protein THASP1DRAFT_31338 [Thamnocephalis sphaerospora]